MKWFVYILRNQKGRQYVGHTQDLSKRLEEHNDGSVTATKKGKPWNIEWFCCFKDKIRAINFEKYLKSGSGTTFRFKHLVTKKD